MKNQYKHLSTRANEPLKKSICQYNLDTEALEENHLADNFLDPKMGKQDKLILTSPCDLGVCLNGGRRGAKFAPEAILFALGKMQEHQKEQTIALTNLYQGSSDSKLAQKQESQAHQILEISQSCSWKKLLHIGGGHDHALPLLSGLTALKATNSRLICINFDAHLDTRNDQQCHSGTPFRQWLKSQSSETLKSIEFHQIGIHQEANTPENYLGSELTNMRVHHYDQIAAETQNFVKIGKTIQEITSQIKADDCLYISLDCDAFDASEFPAVSASNAKGLPYLWFLSCLELLSNSSAHKKCFGVYEYNPLFDDLGISSAKKVAFLAKAFL